MNYSLGTFCANRWETFRRDGFLVFPGDGASETSEWLTKSTAISSEALLRSPHLPVQDDFWNESHDAKIDLPPHQCVIRFLNMLGVDLNQNSAVHVSQLKTGFPSNSRWRDPDHSEYQNCHLDGFSRADQIHYYRIQVGTAMTSSIKDKKSGQLVV